MPLITILLGIGVFFGIYPVEQVRFQLSYKTEVLKTALPLSPTITPEQTRTMIPSPTPIPTLQKEKAKHLLELMNNENCTLPCFLGIVPGKTEFREAEQALINLGMSEPVKYVNNEGIVSYTFFFNIGNNSLNKEMLSQSLAIYISDDIVQGIDIVAATSGFEASKSSIETYRQYWKGFSAQQVFKQLGRPESISVGESRQRQNEYGDYLLLNYDQKNIAIKIYGTKKENNLCPDNEAKFLLIHLLLSYPDSPYDLYEVMGMVPFSDKTAYRSIEEYYDTNTDDFYQKVQENPDVCFKPKLQ
jgi:hypothetical protein